MLLVLFGLSLASGCVECDLLKDSPRAHILTSFAEGNHLEAYVYYENFTGAQPRMPLSDSTVSIEVTGKGGRKAIYKVVTDGQGKAVFDFTDWASSCSEFKVLYCPFCDPEAPLCGFAYCLDHAAITNESGHYENVPGPIESAADIPGPAAGSTNRYLPDVRLASYRAPQAV